MAEYFKDLYSSFIEPGLELPEDLSQKDDKESGGSIRDFIQALRPASLDRFLLLDLVLPGFCRMEAGSEVKEIVDPYTEGGPGFSNKPFEPKVAKEVRAIIAKQKVVAATICKEKAQDEAYKRDVINENVVRNMVADCEKLLVYGNGEEVAGLLRDSNCTTIERKDEPKLLDFCGRALVDFYSCYHSQPTHIVLPHEEICQLPVENPNSFSTQEYPSQLFGVPLVGSHFLPKKRGLILAVNDIILISSPGLEWEFGRSNDELRTKGLSKIIIKYKVSILVRRPGAVAQLILEDKKG